MLEAIAAVAAQSTGAAGQPAQPGLESFLLPLLVIGFLFYFMILRPQRREQTKVQDMRSSIKKGDKVRSIGGIYGTVAAVDINKNIVTVTVDKNVKLDFDREAIATVFRDKDDPEPTADAKSEEKGK